VASVNKVILLGHLGRDPEVRYLPNSDAVCNFSIATTETWKDKSGEKQEKTEWHRIVLFRRIAEIAGEYLKKGSAVYVEGRLQTREWEKDGVKHYSTEIVGDRMQLLGKSNGQQQREQAGRDVETMAAAASSRSPPKTNTVGGADFDDDIPF
jgi:single-strand DNA-binding protein